MSRSKSVIVVAVLASVALGSAALVGQATPPGPAGTTKGAILGTGSFTAFVENMDRSLAFYHDVFGLDVPALPASGQRPYNPPNPQLFVWFDIPGARERHQSARAPGTRVTVEFMEIQDVEHKTIPMRIQDPGAATLVLLVRDMNTMLARLKQANVPIVTPGGRPVTRADGSRAILIQDIDKRFVELREAESLPVSDTPLGDVVDMLLSIAVNDMDQTTRVYRDVFGFTVEGETKFTADAATRMLTGLDKAQVRRSRVQAPGSTLWIEFVEFKGVDRTALRMRIQDRGAARLQLRAQNIDALVVEMKKAGLRIASQGGVAIAIPPNLKGAVVADPNNFFLTPYAPCDGCAPGLRAPAPRQ